MSHKTSIKILSAFLLISLLSSLFALCAVAEENVPQFNLECESAILMEATTGRVFYEKNADKALPPASVTKIMTLLLVFEAIDNGKISLSDMVTASENAASKGGSQIYLKVGESMTVEELIKSVVIASANDAAVALAEYVSGSEETFVSDMNRRAEELKMLNTHFENTNGLDDTTESHLTSARDIAIMSCELLKHGKILEYSSIWMDTVRNGEFGLTNTNRLIRFYSGANGLKTGYTQKAKYCISATAKRNGMQLIAVIMASPTSDKRNEAAKKLLDYGFAEYAYVSKDGEKIPNVTVKQGKNDCVTLKYDEFGAVVKKSESANISFEVSLPEFLTAPIHEGETVGELVCKSGDTVIGSIPICSTETVDKITFADLFVRIFQRSILIK